MDWILHIDTDELMYPGGGPEYSIQRVLAAVPADVDTLVFPNYESLPERDDVQDPFTEARASAQALHDGVLVTAWAGMHTQYNVRSTNGALPPCAPAAFLGAADVIPVPLSWLPERCNLRAGKCVASES